MGARLNVRIFHENDPKVVSKKWASEVEDAKHKYGHGGYTGSIAEFSYNINFVDKVLTSYDDAEEFIETNHAKWSPPLAVKFVSKLATVSKTKEKLKEKTEKLQMDAINLESMLSNEISTAKSKTIGCSKCESKINRSYVKGHNCPVCSGELLSPTARKRLDNAIERYKKAKKEYNNYTPKVGKSSKTAWLIGGWCSE